MEKKMEGGKERGQEGLERHGKCKRGKGWERDGRKRRDGRGKGRVVTLDSAPRSASDDDDDDDDGGGGGGGGGD